MMRGPYAAPPQRSSFRKYWYREQALTYKTFDIELADRGGLQVSDSRAHRRNVRGQRSGVGVVSGVAERLSEATENFSNDARVLARRDFPESAQGQSPLALGVVHQGELRAGELPHARQGVFTRR